VVKIQVKNYLQLQAKVEVSTDNLLCFLLTQKPKIPPLFIRSTAEVGKRQEDHLQFPARPIPHQWQEEAPQQPPRKSQYY